MPVWTANQHTAQVFQIPVFAPLIPISNTAVLHSALSLGLQRKCENFFFLSNGKEKERNNCKNILYLDFLRISSTEVVRQELFYFDLIKKKEQVLDFLYSNPYFLLKGNFRVVNEI